MGERKCIKDTYSEMHQARFKATARGDSPVFKMVDLGFSGVLVVDGLVLADIGPRTQTARLAFNSNVSFSLLLLLVLYIFSTPRTKNKTKIASDLVLTIFLSITAPVSSERLKIIKTVVYCTV